jgi:hypothetical protein
MDRVAAEIAQKIGVLLENKDIDPRPRQEVSQRHSGRAAASDATAALQFSQVTKSRLPSLGPPTPHQPKRSTLSP